MNTKDSNFDKLSENLKGAVLSDYHIYIPESYENIEFARRYGIAMSMWKLFNGAPAARDLIRSDVRQSVKLFQISKQLEDDKRKQEVGGKDADPKEGSAERAAIEHKPN